MDMEGLDEPWGLMLYPVPEFTFWDGADLILE